MPERARFLCVILAAVLLGCQPGPSPEAEDSAPTATPPPPAIPTRPRLTPTSTTTPTPTPTATPLPIQPMSIAFGSLRGGKPEVFLAGPDGQFVSPLLTDDSSGDVVWPDVSPDGTQVVFAAVHGSGPLVSEGLFLSSLDGDGLLQLTEGDDRHPRWSPDGTRIAYTCRSGQDVCVIGAEGGEPTNLTADSERVDMAPAWTPDGRIVFMSSRDVSEGGRFSEIYIMDGDGSGPTRLTDDETAYNAFPDVSPDGAQIVFESDRDVAIGSDLYAMDIDGENPSRLTSDPAWNQNPVWSPDGARILFAGNYGDGNIDLYLINNDGTNRFRITAHNAEDGGLRLGHSWLPVGLTVEEFEPETPFEQTPPALPQGAFRATNAIIFTARDDNCDACLESGIYTVAVDGTNLDKLSVEGLFPTWSPDFRHVAFIQDGELFVAGSGGERPVQFTRAWRGLGPLRWRADSSVIVAACTPYGEPDVCVIDLETGRIKNLTEEITGDSTIFPPFWYRTDQIAHGTDLLDLDGVRLSSSLPGVGRASPDGSQVATLIERQIVLLSPGSDAETQLTDTDTAKDYPVWSPQGDVLVFTEATEEGYLYLNALQVGNGTTYRVLADPIAAEPTPLQNRVRTYLGFNWSP